jgi:DUF1680 family protein
MGSFHFISRRKFMQTSSLFAAGLAMPSTLQSEGFSSRQHPLLAEVGYADVTITSELHKQQLEQTHSVLMGLSDDSLLKPFRQMIGQSAPGDDLGGWYHYDPNYDWHTFGAGFAPACTFGQWVSALARKYAINPDPQTRDKVLRLNRLYATAIAGDFYVNNRFPAYCYDKLVCGLIDSHKFVGDPDAYRILDQTTDVALPHLPGKAIEHGKPWRPGKDESYTWDESYTNAENLFLAYQRGAGDRYRDLGKQYLADFYYGPLAEGENVLAGRHAYSHVNSLCSAMQAYMTLGSEMHLRAAKNGFDILTAQSFATGGWGPDELLRPTNSDEVTASLTNTHSSFETPCGAYAHFKLTRYLLRVTRDTRHGDSMERVMYNTILGAKPLQPDGRTFYYADYNFKGKKVYRDVTWPCCSGTMPQVAADYGINSYFRDSRGVYVNLYIPSTLNWTQDGKQISLTQKGLYPFDSLIIFELNASHASEFELNFRIPFWAEGASISVNGKRRSEPIFHGSFATIRRKWKNGDRIELELPLAKRLESIDAQHPNTVALLSGPLVLFPITDSQPIVTREQLLAARTIGQQNWAVETATGSLKMLPFTAINEEQYSTYLITQ